MMPMESAHLMARLDAGLLRKGLLHKERQSIGQRAHFVANQKCVCNQREILPVHGGKGDSCYQREMLAGWQQGYHYPAGWCIDPSILLLWRQHQATAGNWNSVP
jgi:hypothetical protein